MVASSDPAAGGATADTSTNNTAVPVDKPKEPVTEATTVTATETTTAQPATAIPTTADSTTAPTALHVDTSGKEAPVDSKADEVVNGPAETNIIAVPVDEVNPLDFEGTVDTNNEIPSAATLRKIENYIVLDRHGKTHTFKSLYTGKHVARRVLLIFVRHFFCGNCQEYLRALSASITTEALLRLPVSTFIAVIGCGDPGLIDMYVSETNCPFPVYADPTRKLYSELGMVRTLALGPRPAYMSKSIFKSSLESIVQGLKQVSKGLATKAGDSRQIGGEFLFEPQDVQSPVATPWAETDGKELGAEGSGAEGGKPSSSLDGTDDSTGFEEKTVTWCHRMKNTRDHAEIPELMEVLGLDGEGQPSQDKKRWNKARRERKGTGHSMARQMSQLHT